jgi:hypothetical protein
MRATTYGWQACRRINVGVGLQNINLEQHARQDQIARVSRATVAEATTQDATDVSAMILR